MTAPVSPSSQPSAPARAPNLKWWLIASAALNLLLLGIIGGALIAKHHRGPMGGLRSGPEDFGLMSFARTLPDDRRDAIKKDLGEARTRLKPYLETIAAARTKAAGLLEADPFDRAALKQALEAVQTEDMKRRTEGLTVFLDQAEKLTLEERRSLAELWKKRTRHRSPKADPDEKPR